MADSDEQLAAAKYAASAHATRPSRRRHASGHEVKAGPRCGGAGTAQRAGPPAAQHPTKLPVLIIDDHVGAGRALEHILCAAGVNAAFHPVWTRSGDLAAPPLVRDGIALLALDLLGHDQPDGLVDASDLIAPLRAAGWRVLLLADSPRCGHEPVSADDAARLDVAVAAGARGWVHKSDPLDDVLAALTETADG